MQCPNCNAPVESNATFCGNCGRQLSPIDAQGTTIADSLPGGITISSQPTMISTEARQSEPELNAASRYPRGQTPALDSTPGLARTELVSGTPQPRVDARYGSSSPATATDVPTHVTVPPPQKPRRNNLMRLALVGAIIIIFAGGIVGVVAFMKSNNNTTPTSTTPAAPALTGIVKFGDSANNRGATDALTISIAGLKAPASGMQYNAWLINTAQEHTIPLGTLALNNQNYTLSYPGDGQNGKAGTNLLGAGNKIIITQEQPGATLPTGNVLLSGTFPPNAFIHVRHLLYSFPNTPGNVGLVVGLLNQAQLLNAEALLLQNAVANKKPVTTGCLAQSIVNIIEGAQGAHFQDIAQRCASKNLTQRDNGDGFGILGNNGYAAVAAQHDSLAMTSADANAYIKTHGTHVQTSIKNIQGWVGTIEQDTLNLLNNPNDTSKVSEIVQLANQAYNGIDINGDEQVDPVPGEAGAITAYDHAQLMATLSLNPGA